jgi:hypothetical protein
MSGDAADDSSADGRADWTPEEKGSGAVESSTSEV